MVSQVTIGNSTVGLKSRCFIIAEAGVNHNGDSLLARKLVDVAAECGADAVKFQTFKAERVVSGSAPKARYQLQTTDPDESQLDMLRGLELSQETYRDLQEHCLERGVLFMSTPFDAESADLLDELEVPVLKVASGELTNWPFLVHLARKGKPIILSTGMSYLSEVDEALRVIRNSGNDQIVLLHCTSNYPASPADANLRAMQTMAGAFLVPVGYSDHTAGIEVALAAVALGACAIEKHFTMDRNMRGPDHRASLEPAELRAMISGIRNIESALGHGLKVPVASESDNRAKVRRSLTAARDVPVGTVLEPEMINALRPACGISPALLNAVVGRKVKRALSSGEFVSWNDIE